MILNSFTWTASPELFSVGPITVRWYGLMFAIGFLVGYEIVYRIFRHEGARESWVGSLFIYVVVATIVDWPATAAPWASCSPSGSTADL